MEEAFVFVSIFCNNSKKQFAWFPLVTPLIQKLLLFQIKMKREEIVHPGWFQGCLAYLQRLEGCSCEWIICPPGLWLPGNDFTPLGCIPQQTPAHPDSAAQGSRPNSGGQGLQNSSALGSTGEPRHGPSGMFIELSWLCGVLNIPKEIVRTAEQGNWMLRMPTKPQHSTSEYGSRITFFGDQGIPNRGLALLP